jgi:hypothetical protein
MGAKQKKEILSLLGIEPRLPITYPYALSYEDSLTRLGLESEFVLRPTVSRPVRLGFGLPFGSHD